MAERDAYEGVVAGIYAKRVSPEWEQHKNRGNEALKAGDHDGAVAAYSDALTVAQGREPQMKALLAALRERPTPAASAAARALLSNNGVAQLVGQFLPHLGLRPLEPAFPAVSTQVSPVREPNRPAAVCLANRALVHFQRGRLEASLADALASAEELPEYVKAHHRVRAAHAALAKRAEQRLQALLSGGEATGDVGAQAGALRGAVREHKQAAADRAEAMQAYERGRALPYQGAALIGAGWLDATTDVLLYQSARFAHICAAIRGNAPRWREGEGDSPAQLTVGSSNCSLVNFGGAQWLLMGVTCCTLAFERYAVKAMKLLLMDPENGNELDMPPHGRPSAASRAKVPAVLAQYIKDLKSQARVRVGMLQLGQGLIEMVEVVQGAMAEAGLGEQVRTHAAGMTAAAQAHAMQQMGLPTGYAHLDGDA
jgi:hypothetical protein